MLTMNGFSIRKSVPLPIPGSLRQEIPLSEQAEKLILDQRQAIRDIVVGQDKRFLIIAGPCSIHSEQGALEYARKFKLLADKVASRIFMVMRAYFHKPRTIIDWKGLLNDPFMDGTCNMEEGLRMARRILCEISAMGVPVGTEALDNIAHQYIADAISWAGIGARTVSSSIHKELASGLSTPVGIKNAEDGSVRSAICAIKAAMTAQAFFGINVDTGLPEAEYTKGNPYAHLVLRGGGNLPNYADGPLLRIRQEMFEAGISSKIMVDCSHGNSWKDHTKQADVLNSVLYNRINGDEDDLVGAMLESYLKPGKQQLDVRKGPEGLSYDVSITDACIGWEETEELVLEAYEKMREEEV